MTGEQRRGEGPYRTWARHRGGILQPLYFYLICLHYTPNTFTFILLYSVSRLFVQFWTDFRATWWIRWTRRRWSDTASTRMVARLCGAKDIVLAFSTFTRLCDDAIPRKYVPAIRAKALDLTNAIASGWCVPLREGAQRVGVVARVRRCRYLVSYHGVRGAAQIPEPQHNAVLCAMHAVVAHRVVARPQPSLSILIQSASFLM